MGLIISYHARALLCNGLGRYAEARAIAERACEHEDLGVFAWALTELVEAATRSGEPGGRGRRSNGSRRRRKSPAPTGRWVSRLGSRALVSEGGAAEGLYREAIERLGRTRIRVEVARAHLVYGEWLRRAGRPHRCA